MNTKTKECFGYCYEWLRNQGGEEESFMKRMEELAKGVEVNTGQETYNFANSISIEEARLRWPEK